MNGCHHGVQRGISAHQAANDIRPAPFKTDA